LTTNGILRREEVFKGPVNGWLGHESMNITSKIFKGINN